MPTTRIAAALLAAATLLTLAPSAVAAPSSAASPYATVDLQPELNTLVEQGTSTAALAEVRDHGRVVWRGAAGTADLATGQPATADGRFRIASTTKSFVSTVTLQLVDEGRVRLDDPIEHYLPGAIPNGGAITVRQLLNHTSGLYNYLDDPHVRSTTEAGNREFLATGRWIEYTPQHLLAIGTAKPPYFAPGQGWHYSNTNYVVIGMLIEQVTGHSWRDEVEARIIQPLGLRHTTLPTDSTAIPGPHAHGYFKFPEGPGDVTRLSPTIADAAGAGISTTDDLARFHAALFGGRLLSPAQLAEMTTTVPIPDAPDHAEYGLGVVSYDLSCGRFWGHPGEIPGYSTGLLGTRDGGRQYAISYNEYDKSDSTKSNRLYRAFEEKALCGGPTTSG
ncbi:serine hydrolase [Kitasatospora sp. SUK 42]|uniref:serine hydrolase domain-containing protein n=1 Tax=Kitasatospora sp. SUK 42 TaxID=1588882 RepID=UPI0018CBAE60|nr:serine hydrolase domain-containing protein [Kitasatospora sp. SUK 42]MBV2154121.1 beta-lactamase family protein [Kitasatospora sp. SUK 42]